MKTMAYMRIKQLAKRVSTSPRSIRFYEEKGLLHPKKDKVNDYRLFTDEDVWRLQTILLLREMGMSLRDIRNVLNAMDQNGKDTVENHLELQRAALYTQWIELSYAIETTEQVVTKYQRTGLFEDAAVSTLVGSLKRIRESREAGDYQWNFDDRASTFDKEVLHAKSSWSIHSDYQCVLDAIVNHIQPVPGEKALELAIGTGNLAAKFVESGVHMSGVDQSFEMLRQCRAKYPTVVTKLGNMLVAPFYSGTFDFVVSSYAFHLLTNEQQVLALREVDRLMRSDGRLCIADHMFVDPQHRQTVIAELEHSGDKLALEAIRTHNIADASRLISWLQDHAYQVCTTRVTESVQLIFARKPT